LPTTTAGDGGSCSHEQCRELYGFTLASFGLSLAGQYRTRASDA
jgi:hypothetical protein